MEINELEQLLLTTYKEIDGLDFAQEELLKSIEPQLEVIRAQREIVVSSTSGVIEEIFSRFTAEDFTRRASLVRGGKRDCLQRSRWIAASF